MEVVRKKKMSEPISVRKLLDFTPTALVKSSSQTLKGLLVLIAIGLIGWAVYKAFVKRPEPTQTQHTVITSPAKVEIDQRQIVISREVDRFFFGLKFKLIWWPVKIGISMPQEVKEAEIKPVEIKK